MQHETYVHGTGWTQPLSLARAKANPQGESRRVKNPAGAWRRCDACSEPGSPRKAN